ncbi:MAG: GGDEF domain-containing protein, partial [Acinetobacter sp.]
LPDTTMQHAEKIAAQLERMITISAYYHRDLSIIIPLKARTTCCSVGQYQTAPQLLSALNQQLLQLKQHYSPKRVSV